MFCTPILIENQEYTAIMGDLRDLLCSRTDKIQSEFLKEGIALNHNVSLRVEEQQAKADNATLQKDY